MKLRKRHALMAAGWILLTAAVQAAEWPGEWRVQQVQPAPWVPEGAELPASAIAPGEVLALSTDRLQGPGVLNCAQATVSTLTIPPPGLFQGGLPAPAEDAARALGFAAGDIESLRVDCSSGSFDFHFADAATLLFALDNRIYTLGRHAGSAAATDSPEARSQALLEAHFAGDMGFSVDSWAGKRRFLSSALQAALDAYFARDFPADEVPPINGDPLTDSQEYPTRFAIDAARIEAEVARVTVRYADGWSRREVEFEWAREQGEWRLRELVYPRGERFSGWLRQ